MTRELPVSVLMTAYNRERYIGQAIESVLASTLKDFELIVVDDASSDRTVEIARSYAARDNRVRVEMNERNVGDYANRNRAASLARGTWLKYVDSDDYIYPHGLEIMVAAMSRFPGAALGVSGLPALRDRPYPVCLSPREAYRYHYFDGLPVFHKGPLGAIIARSAWAAVGGFQAGPMLGDFEMWHRLSKSFSLVLITEGLVWYRVHGEQEMAIHGRQADYWGLRYQSVTQRALLDPDTPLTASERVQVARRIIAQNLWVAVRRALKGRLSIAAAYLSTAWRIAASLRAYRCAPKAHGKISAKSDEGSNLGEVWFEGPCHIAEKSSQEN